MSEDQFRRDVLDHVERGSKSDNEMEREQAGRLLSAFANWLKVEAWAKSERKRVSDAVKEHREGLREAIEEPIAEGTDGEVQEQIRKLFRCENRWQEFTEAEEERKLIGSATRDQLKAAKEKIVELIAESNQLGLDFEGSEDAE